MTVDAVEQIADEIATGADLEQDAGGYQALDKRSILDAPDAVADARHLQPIQRFPYAVGALRLAGVGDDVTAGFAHRSKGRYVIGQRVTRFVGG